MRRELRREGAQTLRNDIAATVPTGTTAAAAGPVEGKIYTCLLNRFVNVNSCKIFLCLSRIELQKFYLSMTHIIVIFGKETMR